MTDRLYASRPAGRVLLAGVAAAVMAVALAGLYAWDNWFLNPDGAFYLSVVDSLLAGAGPRFPDGAIVSLRGPAFPIWLSAGWALFEDTTRTAIWTSRSLLVLNAGLVAWAAGRWGWPAAFVSGLVAGIGPLYLLAGGLFLVPDALAATFVILAVIALQTGRPLVAGLALGVGLLSKETAVLAVAAIALAALFEEEAPWRSIAMVLLGSVAAPGVWLAYLFSNRESAPVLVVATLASLAGGAIAGWLHRRTTPAPPRGWAVVGWLTLVASALVVLSLSVAALVPLGEWWTLFDREIRNQLFGTAVLWPVGIALVLVLAGSLKSLERDLLPGLMVTGVGIAALVHAAVAGLGLRNGLLAAYGLALVIGWLVGSDGWRRMAGLAAAVALLATGLGGAEFVNGKFDTDSLTWDAQPVHDTAAFLEQNASSVVTTSAFGPWLAHLAPSPSFFLAPTGIVNERVDDGLPPIDSLADWAGTKPNPAEPLAEIVGVLRKQTISAARVDLWRVIGETGATHVVVTGNVSSAAASTDGGLWLVLADDDPGLERRFATSLAQFPHWLVVYEVVGRQAPAPRALEVYYVADPPAGDYPPETSFNEILDFRDEVLRILGSS